jgi:cell division protein FtsZ
MVSELIKEAVDPSANIKFGAQINEDLEDEIVITIVATGIKKSDRMYSTSQEDDYTSVKEESSSSQVFSGFTTPGMEKKLNEDDNKTNKTGGLEFTMSEDEEEEDIDDNKQDEDSDDDSNAPFELDSKDPLDVPAFMRKKNK